MRYSDGKDDANDNSKNSLQLGGTLRAGGLSPRSRGGLLQARHEVLTGNNNTPYLVTFLDTRGGPVVLDVPPASGKVMLFGSGIDSWEVPLVDVGPTGEDAGHGGKYLFLPPRDRATAPQGYIVTPSPTYFLHFGLRPIMSKDATFEDVVAYSRTVKVYPLADSLESISRGFVKW